MPITTNSKLIEKYLPEKHKAGSCVQVDNSGFTLLKDSFICIFPSIMSFKEFSPFYGETTVSKFRWASYLIFEGVEYLFISKDESYKSLVSEIEASPINLFKRVEIWYNLSVLENEQKIVSNVWKAHASNDLIIYLKLQSEYGFMQDELKTDKHLLFPKDKKTVFLEKLKLILMDKLLTGQITQIEYKQLLTKYVK